MRHLLLTAVLLLAYTPPASATGPCPTSLTPMSWGPTGTTSSDTVTLEAEFEMDWSHCNALGIVGCTITLDGESLTSSCTETYIGQQILRIRMETEVTELTEGAHYVSATVHTNTSSDGWYPISSTIAWSFNVARMIHGETFRYDVGDKQPADIPRACPVVACVGGTTLTIPIPARLHVEGEGVGAFYWGEGIKPGTYGPDDRSVSTPFGTIPIILCPNTCPIVAPDAHVATEGIIHVSVDAAGSPVVEREIRLQQALP